MPKSKKRKASSSGEAQRRAKAQSGNAQQAATSDLENIDSFSQKYDAAGERKLLTAGVRLLSALEEYQAEARQYERGAGCLELDEGMRSLAWSSDSLERELLQLQRAIDVIEEDIPIAARSEHGRAWKPRLSPQWLHYFLGLAKPGDTGYIPQLMALIEKDKARELDAECGRTTKAGTPCKAIPVYWPGRGRDSACTRHLTVDEKASLETVWAGIEQTHACPGCYATAGQRCSEEASGLVLVDGEWPRIRGFGGRQLHDVRLALA